MIGIAFPQGTPKEIMNLLLQSGFTFSHRLGQNFLIDPRALADIIDEAEVGPGDHLLEVGAGAGMLTVELARRASAVAAVELDRRLIGVLTEVLGGRSNVSVIHGDIMAIDTDAVFAGLSERFGPPAGARRVVGNLPYYITSPVLMKFLEETVSARRPWATMTVTVQREVADRLLAGPGSKDYGALTVAVNYYAEIRGGRVIPPGSFRPSPKVASRVVTLVRRVASPIDVNRGVFFRLVRAGFGQRRKTLANALAGWTREGDEPEVAWAEVLREAGVDPRRRAETLSLEEFGALAQAAERRLLGPR